MRLTKVQGLKELISALKKTKKDIGDGFARGLKKAGLWIQRESQLIVPVHTGFLKAGAFTRAIGSGWNTEVHVGYMAAYAIYVHEDLDKLHGRDFNRAYSKEIQIAKAGRAKRNKGTVVGAFLYKKRKEKNPPWYADMSTKEFIEFFHSRGENQIAKFLTIPVDNNHDVIAGIVRREVKNSF